MYEKLAFLIDALIDRWTSKSPKAAVWTTNIAFVIGIAASAVPYIPYVAPLVTIPLWSIQLSSFLIALTAKMTKK